MSLPKVIGPVTPKDGLLSIIYELKNTYEIADPISKNIVIPSSSKVNQGNIESMINWNAEVFQTGLKKGENVYFQLAFLSRYLFPTAYSIRGVPSNLNRFYATKWKVEGFNFGEEEDEKKWVLLAENNSSEGDFCGTGKNCNGKKVATFRTKETKKGFRYIRFTSLDTSGDDGTIHFTSSGVDVYGTLRTASNLPCTCNGKSSQNFLLFVAFIYTT